MSTVRIGGLFRCCVQLAEQTEGVEGQRLQCPDCKDWLIYRLGAWEWDHHPQALMGVMR